VIYDVERIYLTDQAGLPHTVAEIPVQITAESAHDAALLFVKSDDGKLLGAITTFPGDRAHASVWKSGRLYVITVEPAAD
jgi:hypothetical protein